MFVRTCVRVPKNYYLWIKIMDVDVGLGIGMDVSVGVGVCKGSV